ncbi:MAG: hypothetical protein EZS28_046558 [Streblomastix strix]|uniref:Uncharacterized protein n=1 Tax=Streblomastix strix TaxID=222440 RepID=A0A5J4TKA6_9EUKA|nr:MAG: hypothetical protein EZS28_046558 [Streblomastix strix]
MAQWDWSPHYQVECLAGGPTVLAKIQKNSGQVRPAAKKEGVRYSERIWLCVAVLHYSMLWGELNTASRRIRILLVSYRFCKCMHQCFPLPFNNCTMGHSMLCSSDILRSSNFHVSKLGLYLCLSDKYMV